MTNSYLQRLATEIELELKDVYIEMEKKAMLNHVKLLNAFHEARVSDFHFKGSSGYGYGDSGRDILEQVFCNVFKAEAALVRGQIVSGTHALALCLYGLLRPGDELMFVQGRPYDTLEAIIGRQNNQLGSLADFNISYKQIELLNNSSIDYQSVSDNLGSKTKMVLLQRSGGYSLRPSLTMEEMRNLVSFIKQKQPKVIIMVDNCYGELVDTMEPLELGADIIAGSLIKNPGGGIAPTGGYVAGKKELVQMAANRWTAPGVGSEIGPVFEWQRLFFQGLFLAPHIVCEALKGAAFASLLFERLGFKVEPKFNTERHDIIQTITLGSPELLVAFCHGLQKGSPVDAHVLPEPWDMPGYDDQVIMAAGTFVQGASLELTADAPMRPPYTVFFQGGLSKEYAKLGVLSAASEVLKVLSKS